ncbi:MAG: protein-disulfide reductase DsbD family protein, partial [Cyclobacteriaceae bacterium]|nr:protein-disulfide reductase DsbD family protein [Cyclobacteriaceae bacterium]
MRITFFILFAFIFSLAAKAQILQPAKLTSGTLQNTAKVGDVIDLVFKAQIDENWYIYSLGFDEDCGPIPISITLDKHPSFELVGGVKAINDESKHDKIFDCDVRIFKVSGEFRQKIKILSKDLVLKGVYEGQVCSEVDGKCVLFDGDLAFGKLAISGDDKQQVVQNPKAEESTSSSTAPLVAQAIDTTTTKTESVKVYSDKITGPILDETLINESAQQQSFWLFFALAFVAGLAALLTPCVFPMIPMTV